MACPGDTCRLPVLGAAPADTATLAAGRPSGPRPRGVAAGGALRLGGDWVWHGTALSRATARPGGDCTPDLERTATAEPAALTWCIFAPLLSDL